MRHLCLTDLARADWDTYEIAIFAVHRNIEAPMIYIHLDVRDLAAKLTATPDFSRHSEASGGSPKPRECFLRGTARISSSWPFWRAGSNQDRNCCGGSVESRTNAGAGRRVSLEAVPEKRRPEEK
jgi:hypothetical protein